MIEQLKRLPPLEHENFAMAFKNVNKTLSKRQDDKLLRLQEMPRRLPDALVQPKVKFRPGRKRALTRREAGDQQEKEEIRERRRGQAIAVIQGFNDARADKAVRW
jgi:hypothetical protein